MRKFAKPALFGLLLVVTLILLSGVLLFTDWVPGIRLAGQPADPLASSGVVKIITGEAGIYEVAADVPARYGISLENPDSLFLSNRGELRPTWITKRDGKAVVRFYAEAYSSLYSDENVYWLSNDPELFPQFTAAESAGAAESASPMEGMVPPQGAVLAMLPVEQNLFYSPLVKQGDHWLWAALNSPQSQEFDFQISDLADGDARLQLSLWSALESDQPVDHRLQVSLNGALVADESWDGSGYHQMQVSLPDGSLAEGENRLILQLPGVDGLPVDIQNLNGFTVIYPQRPVAREGRVEVRGAGGAILVEGLQPPAAAYDLSDQAAPAIFSENLEADPATGKIAFQGEAGKRYLLVGSDGYLSPLRIEPASLTVDLHNPQTSAAYLAIAPDDLLAPLDPLLDARRAGGLSALAVPLQAVYDQFNAGIPDPGAIRELLLAAADWQAQPRYLLLVGDASYDPLGYLAPPEANRLPTFFVDTRFGGQTASDVPFAQKLPPGAPASQIDPLAKLDLAVGRFPAQTARQVSILVEKTLQFDRQAAEGKLHREAVAVADGESAVYRGVAQNFLDQLPASYATELLAPPIGATGVNETVKTYFDGGKFLIAYFGHGSLTMWGKDLLFSSQDVPALSGGERLPILIQLTCLTGLFTHPTQESLTESLLWKEDGGAVAAFAPTSLTLPQDESELALAIASQLASSNHTRLGDLLAAARNQIETTDATMQDVLLTFMLFGDPALSLPANQ